MLRFRVRGLLHSGLNSPGLLRSIPARFNRWRTLKKKTPMPIRPARSADLAAVAQCAADAYRKYVTRIGREPAPMVADFAAQIDAGILHVFDNADAVAGFIVFYPRGDRIHLENVAVAEHAQGRGIGRALIAFCEASARDGGFTAIELYTNVKMTENLALYPRLGYRETARRTEDGFDRVYFEKSIG